MIITEAGSLTIDLIFIIIKENRIGGSAMNKEELWNQCTQFHGHVCPGLMIGFRASLYAMELLKLTFSEDEKVVCISENDTCSVDAVQAMLGCSVGKGNLLFHMRGKQAYSFYNRATGSSVRIVLNPKPCRMTREESFAYYRDSSAEELFTVKDNDLPS